MSDVLTSKPEARKAIPMARGVLDYFPGAVAEVAVVSRVANDQHNPGEEMHWARGKSTDHADCIIRHLVDRGKHDSDGLRHTAKVAWRALALLQEELEAEGMEPGRASVFPEELPLEPTTEYDDTASVEPPSAVPPPAASAASSPEDDGPGALFVPGLPHPRYPITVERDHFLAMRDKMAEELERNFYGEPYGTEELPGLMEVQRDPALPHVRHNGRFRRCPPGMYWDTMRQRFVAFKTEVTER